MNRINQHQFLSNWKTTDKDWMKQRRLEWKKILFQLDRVRTCNIFFDRVKKSDYKFFKSYYLTGKDDVQMPSENSCRCLLKHNPDTDEGLLIQFWLSADLSGECLEYLKDNVILNGDEHYNNNTLFNGACETYRKTIYGYPLTEKYSWNEVEGTTEKNGPIFGELEPKMLELFTFSSGHKKKLDDQIHKPKHDNLHTVFEGVFLGYFETFIKEADVREGFNPNNPIRYMLDEYVRWGFPQNRGEYDIVAFKLAIAVAWHTVDTPDGRHPIQYEVAKELKQRILDGLVSMPIEAQNRYDMAMKYYESGEFRKYLLDCQ